MSDEWVIWSDSEYRFADTRDAAIKEAAAWSVYAGDEWTGIDAIEGPSGELVDLESELSPVVSELWARNDRYYEEERQKHSQVLLVTKNADGHWTRGCIHYDTPSFRVEYGRVLARLGAERVELTPWPKNKPAKGSTT